MCKFIFRYSAEKGNAVRSKYGKIVPGEQKSDFRISGAQRRISHGHIMMRDVHSPLFES